MVLTMRAPSFIQPLRIELCNSSPCVDEKFYTAFDASNPRHVEVLRVLSEMEHSFMKVGEIGIENAFIVGEKH